MLEILPDSACLSNLDSQSGNLLLFLLNTLLASQCVLKNPANYPPDRSSEIQDGDRFDFIVVGSGSSGSVVATRLVETGRFKVLVVEAGGIPSITSEIPALWTNMQFTDQVWNYPTEPSNTSCLGFQNASCLWPRGKLLGGCSAINAMIYVRGNDKDYNSWSEKGSELWNYEHVSNAFKTFEKLHCDDQTNFDVNGKGDLLPLGRTQIEETIQNILFKSAEQLGYDKPKQDGHVGFFENLQTVHEGVRINSAKSFLGSVRNSVKLSLSMNTYVRKLIIDENKKKAEGIEVTIGTRKLKLFADKEIILSAGAIKTPQILMLSGIGPKRHLESLGIKVTQDLNVGGNLQDHLMVFVYSKVSDEAMKPINIQDEIYKYYAHREGVLSTTGLLNIQGFINTRNDTKYPDIQLIYSPLRKNDLEVIELIMRSFNMDPVVTNNVLEFCKKNHVLVTVVVLLKPKSRGKILLRSDDPEQPPLIHTGYLSDENNEDLDTLLKGIRMAEAQIETKALKEVKAEILDIGLPNCKGHEFKSDDYWRCYIQNIGTTIYHPTSTCSMGHKDQDEAVVDPRLRVRGVKNLRVVDASIMPSIVSGNTNGPCMMIGQRGSEMIIEDHKDVHNEL
ncbi:glucose dehydrogenase [FAD, quinone]-like [Harmonia axyridis]|uniref:glucose dehydrogenase [FAD, quinone]-like n=1 Tax=Harmonia axyridis TaxID=115357 RepID=UPI001E279430|nr:glucose dehydrogenase [FAD, quinone]-like [Harmonia axyridis]